MTSLVDLDVAGKRVFLRCDLNVPLKESKITDDGRIRASLPTINALLGKGASIVIAAHLGRPKGEVKPELSLAPVAVRLSELLGKPVQFAGAITGADVTAKTEALLQNYRKEVEKVARTVYLQAIALKNELNAAKINPEDRLTILMHSISLLTTEEKVEK